MTHDKNAPVPDVPAEDIQGLIQLRQQENSAAPAAANDHHDNDQATPKAAAEAVDNLDEPRLFAVSDDNLPLPDGDDGADEKFALEKTVDDDEEHILDISPLPMSDVEKENLTDFDAEHFFSEDLPEHIPAIKNRGESNDGQ